MPIKCLIRSVAVLLMLLTCAGCVYTHPTTGNSYFFSTDYNEFMVEESLSVSPSNFVGFCVLPFTEKDERGVSDLVKGITEQYLRNHGYIMVTQEELREDLALVDHTFLVGFDYRESLLYETIELSIRLYSIDKKNNYKNSLFWQFNCKYEKFPITRSNLEPVFQDLFTSEPVNMNEYATLFPKRGVSNAVYNEYTRRLSAARDRRAALEQSNEFLR